MPLKLLLPRGALGVSYIVSFWQLTIQMTVSPPLSLPLKFPFAGTRGNGPFCAVYRSEVKAAFFLQKATEMSPAVNICLATTRSCTRPFKQFDQNKRGPDFWKGYNFTGGIMTWPKYVAPFFRMEIWWALFWYFSDWADPLILPVLDVFCLYDFAK